MSFYADTSYLFSLFVPDANSARAVQAYSLIDQSLIFSKLNELEITNALSLAVFQKRIARGGATAARLRVRESLSSGALLKVRLDWENIFVRATLLADDLSVEIGSRSLDLLHVAVALTVDAQGFLSFDTRRRTAAARSGLEVFPVAVSSLAH